jgi:excisionase family DNA binding protein
MPEQKYLYTIPETAELIGQSKTTVYELIKSGELLAVYPTTKARIPDASISAYVRRLEERERREVKARRGRFV